MDDQGMENFERVMDMETAIGIAARIWGDPDYEYVIMNPDLAERIAALLMNNVNTPSLHNETNVLAQKIIGGHKNG